MSALRLMLLLLPGLALAQAPIAAPAAGSEEAKAPAAAASGAGVGNTGAVPTLPPAVPAYEDRKVMRELFLRRDEPASLEKLEALLAQGLKAKPDDFELLIAKAQLRWNQADRVQGKAREKLGKEAWELGERAAKLKPHRVEGHYWAGVGVGAYSQGVGLLAALTQGLEGRFNGFIDKAIQLDAGYQDGAPVTAKARAHFELPWPKRNLDKSAELLRQVTAKHAANLRAWLYLAETELERGKAQEAAAALARVQSGSGRYDPPEARYAKRLARALEPKVKAKLK